jgi:dephospho-CoA kinase
MTTRIFGLIGGIASGKTVVADYIVKRKKAGYYRFSDVLRDILLRLHQPNTRENLQNLGVALRKAYGDGILAKTLREDILKDKSEFIVVDGIRYQDEFDMIKELGGVTVYVTAPGEVRYERVKGRGTRGEANINLNDFIECEKRETERLIDSIGAKADHRIENTGTLAELKKKTDELLG